MNALKWT